MMKLFLLLLISFPLITHQQVIVYDYDFDYCIGYCDRRDPMIPKECPSCDYLYAQGPPAPCYNCGPPAPCYDCGNPPPPPARGDEAHVHVELDDGDYTLVYIITGAVIGGIILMIILCIVVGLCIRSCTQKSKPPPPPPMPRA